MNSMYKISRRRKYRAVDGEGDSFALQSNTLRSSFAQGGYNRPTGETDEAERFGVDCVGCRHAKRERTAQLSTESISNGGALVHAAPGPNDGIVERGTGWA